MVVSDTRRASADQAVAPRLAVLVPIYRHSGLVIETIESILAQQTGFALRLVLVNDGCPFPETDQVCREYALAYPDRITYLRKPNGGLSDARNHGIRYVLAHLPSVEAIYLMDADNLLRPTAMARVMAALDEDPDADWIYPDIDMFGLDGRWEYGGPYSVLLHTALNTCEAGSLIRRRVFEAGIFFDTSFKMGWEDWDFFLSAARAGFRGKNIEHFGFLYRKRPESMLADSERDQSLLSGTMRRKHKPVMTPNALLRMEQEEAPRYAIHLNEKEVLLCTDPTVPDLKPVSYDSFEAEYWRSRTSPGRYRVPPFSIFIPSLVFEGLKKSGLLHWVLWALETQLQEHPIAGLYIKPVPEQRMTLEIIENSSGTGEHRSAVVFAMRPDVFHAVMDDDQTVWIDSLSQIVSQAPVNMLVLGIPAADPLVSVLSRPTAVFSCLSLVHRLRASPWRDASKHSWGFRAQGISYRGKEHEIVRQPFNQAPVFPRLPDERRHIGFLLPLIEFGGVEKVALHMARALRAQGWIPHAVVLEARDAHVSREWSDVFESTTFLLGTEFSTWYGGQQNYAGTNIPEWAQNGDHAPAVAMLHWLDVVINFHGGAAAALMGQLRRLGAITVDSLHLNDLSPFGRPVGNTYLGLAYEHAFDFFVPCSHQLGDWLHAMGVPRQKIIPVQNAPGFETDAKTLERSHAARLARGADQPLRVLYLGRLDRQKGLDRLAEVMKKAKAERLDIDWRIIGQTVVKEETARLPSEIAEVLEPPIYRPSALAKAYAWADVVVLLSRFEGLPLTVLEAMRSGAVVTATDVGATSEVVRDGENGILLAEDTAVEECLAALRRLVQDRNWLHTLSRKASADRAGYDWMAATGKLASAINAKLETS